MAATASAAATVVKLLHVQPALVFGHRRQRTTAAVPHRHAVVAAHRRCGGIVQVRITRRIPVDVHPNVETRVFLLIVNEDLGERDRGFVLVLAYGAEIAREVDFCLHTDADRAEEFFVELLHHTSVALLLQAPASNAVGLLLVAVTVAVVMVVAGAGGGGV